MDEITQTLTWEAWQAAIDRYAGKVDVPSALRTAEWSRVPLAIRERAFFSAGVEDARTLQTIRTAVAKALQGTDGNGSYSRADAVADIRKALGAEGDSGDLKDITSYRRLNLIADFQIEQAQEYARHKRDLEDPDLLDAYPAQELVRVRPSRVERNWWTRWIEAGNKVNWGGASRQRRVALKTSPIWSVLSRFGTPFPPFDFGSGMGVEDVDRDAAESLGLIDRDWDAAKAGESALQDFNKDVQASVQNIDDAISSSLKDYFAAKGLNILWESSKAVLKGDQ